MGNYIIDLCNNLIECLNKVKGVGGSTLFNAATGFIDYDGLSHVLDYLGSVGDFRIVVGDLGSIPRSVYEGWRDVIRVYPNLHAKLYLLGNGFAIVGSANLTVGGLYRNEELNVLIRNEELYNKLSRYYEELWRNAKPLTEDYVEDIEEVEVRRARYKPAEFVNNVNKALLNALDVDENCLINFNPVRCSVIIADAINKRFHECGDLPENCVARFVARELNLNPRELARRLMGSPGSAIIAGHPLCWVKAFVNSLLAGHVDTEELRSGVRIYEAVVREAAQKCRGRDGELAREELRRLGDESYRDNYVRWKIPYRLLPLALALPITNCRLVGTRRRGGSLIRRLVCD